MAEIDITTDDCKITKDWIYFVAGGLAALVALYLIKHIIEPEHHHWHNQHHHYLPHPVPIAKQVDRIYKVDYEGKMY